MRPSGAKLAFAIMDDDVSYLTSTEMIKRVHRLALSEGFPLSCTVTPEHGSPNDANVPPSMIALDSRDRGDGTDTPPASAVKTRQRMRGPE